MLMMVCVLALLVAPTAAPALTVSAAGGVITLQAAPGEANSIIGSTNAANLRFHDNGTNLDGTPVVVTAGGGCVQAVANTTVDCPEAGVTAVVAKHIYEGSADIAPSTNAPSPVKKYVTAGANPTCSGE